MTKLISLTMKNYRPFYKEEKILFSTNPKKHFNIIYAGTGSGKTTVLDAISWCLYNEEIHKPQPLKTMLNDKRKDELKKRETADVMVEVILGENEKDIDYVFRRKTSFLKKGDGTVEPQPYTEEFEAKIKDERNNLIGAPDPNVAVRWVFPRDIQHLFMFDGEKLQTFFDEDNIKNTKQAIIDITQIDFLTDAIDHLKSVSRGYRSEDEEEDPQIKELEDSIRALERRKDELIIEKKRVKDDLATAKKDYDIAMGKLRKIDRKDLKRLLYEEERIRKELKEAEYELKDLKLESFKHLLSSVPLLFCKKELGEAIDVIDKKYESGELPPDIKIDFIEKLLKKQQCICHTALKSGSKARKYVDEYKNRSPLSKYETEIRHGQSEIKILLKSTSTFVEERKKYYNDINEAQDKILICNQQLKNIEKDRKGLDKEEIESLYSKRDFEFSEIERYNTRLGEIGEEEKKIDKDKMDWENKKRKLEKNLIVNRKLKEKFTICDTSINFLQNIKEELITEIKKDIEEETDGVFRKGVGEPRVDKVCITDDFECQVLDKNKQNIYGSLSSGQRQTLATAFMIALRKESGFDSPILIDYPFGRIDPTRTSELIQALKDILKGVQVNFFLIEGKEFTDMVQNQMKECTGSVYEIEKVEKEARSEVIKHA